jgi:hypothetical protein
MVHWSISAEPGMRQAFRLLVYKLFDDASLSSSPA